MHRSLSNVKKLPGITKITKLEKMWDANIEYLHEKSEHYFFNNPVRPGELSLGTPDLVTRYGYPIEMYKITTEDQYVLTLYRISKKPKATALNSRPLLLVHGLLSCSDDWVKIQNRSLAYVLVDAGYDVWLANCRGTRHSWRHESYTDKSYNKDLDGYRQDNYYAVDPQYWNYTLHEMATRDLSAMIDLVLRRTDKNQLFYVGFCQGATLLYILLSERPEYNDKIRFNVSLAPIIFPNKLESPILKIIEKLSSNEDDLNAYFPKTYFVAQKEVKRKAAKFINCRGSNADLLCLNNLFVTLGFNPQNIDVDLLPILFNDRTSSHASMKQIIHITQLIKSEKFCQYNYGRLNKTRYGTLDPPEYNLRSITCPTKVFVSDYDWVSKPRDVNLLGLKIVQGQFTWHKILEGRYTHLDFLYGINAYDDIYVKVLEILEAN